MHANGKTTKSDNFVLDDIFSENELAELSEERMKKIKMLNDATDCLQWKKKFEESEAKVAALEKQILQRRERDRLMDAKNGSARNLVQGYLKDFTGILTSETQGLLKSIIRVLNPDSNQFTRSENIHTLQSPDVDSDPGYSISSVQAGSSLEIRNTVAQKSLNIHPTPVSVTRKKHLVKMKHTLFGSCENERFRQLYLGFRSTTTTASTLNRMENSKSSSTEQQNPASKKIAVATATNPQILTPTQSGTLHVENNGNEDVVDEVVSSLITPIAKQAAVQFFYKSLQKDSKQDDDGVTKDLIEKLCIRLKCETMALKLAISYIKEDLLLFKGPLKNVIENYLDKITNEAARPNANVPENVENPTYLAWRLTREKISETPETGKKILKIMQIIAFLSPKNIPIQFVLDLYKSTENKTTFALGENVFQPLKRLSLIISASTLCELISVKPLIQKVIQIDLEEQGKLTEILGSIRKGAIKMIESYGISFLQMDHIESIWKHVTGNHDLVKEAGQLSSFMCWKFIELGKYRKVFDFSWQALAVLLESGEENQWTWVMRFWKGSALESLGKYLESMKVLKEVYEGQKKFFEPGAGENDEDCLDTAQQIGTVYMKLKNYEEALRWYRTTLEKREKISVSMEDKEILSLKNNIALVLHTQEEYQKAAEMYQQVLEVAEQKFGMEHSLTLTTKYNLATVKYSQKMYKKAVNMFRQVQQVQQRVLEKDHPDILITKSWVIKSFKMSLEPLGRDVEEGNQPVHKRKRARKN